jgi:hypothetical protein
MHSIYSHKMCIINALYEERPITKHDQETVFVQTFQHSCTQH